MSAPAPPDAAAAYRDLAEGIETRHKLPVGECPEWGDLPPSIRDRFRRFIRSLWALRGTGRERPTAAQGGRRMTEA